MGKGASASGGRTGSSASGAGGVGVSGVGGVGGGGKAVAVRPRALDLGTYAAALKFLNDRVDVERLRPGRVSRDMFKLDRMRRLLSLLGSPHESLRCVHVAGTKGKGSTCEMTAAALEGCGYVVGTYTSPHLLDLRERVRIDRKMVGQEDLRRLIASVGGAAAVAEKEHGEATYFELMTAAALLHFAEQAVDVAVIEVGLGGELDSTNVIAQPEVSAIATIGHDHTQLLGSTLEAIAREKAGILKSGCAAVSVDQEASAMKVIRDVATERGADLRVLGKEIDFSFRVESGRGGTSGTNGAGHGGPVVRVNVGTKRMSFEHVAVPMRGEHQALNCGLALGVLDRLAERGFSIDQEKALAGLATAELAGRMEVVSETPRVVVDGAHNAESMKALMKALSGWFQYDALVGVFGCCADKDVDTLLRHLSMGADKVVFTQAEGNARAVPAAELARRYAELTGRACQHAERLEDALHAAGRSAGREDLICVTGSLYLVAEAKRVIGEKKKKG